MLNQNATYMNGINEIAFVTSKKSDPSEPQTFRLAWWHSDFKARENGMMESS